MVRPNDFTSRALALIQRSRCPLAIGPHCEGATLQSMKGIRPLRASVCWSGPGNDEPHFSYSRWTSSVRPIWVSKRLTASSAVCVPVGLTKAQRFTLEAVIARAGGSGRPMARNTHHAAASARLVIHPPHLGVPDRFVRGDRG